MLITTIQRETTDDDLFSKSAPILTAASEVAFHTMNTSSLNAEELRREEGIAVRKLQCVYVCSMMERPLVRCNQAREQNFFLQSFSLLIKPLSVSS